MSHTHHGFNHARDYPHGNYPMEECNQEVDGIQTYRKPAWIARCSVAALAFFFLSVHTAQAESSHASVRQDNSAIQIVVAAINGARAQSGLPPLTLNPQLLQAAQGHATDMVTNGNYSHRGTDGSNVNMRVQRAGYGEDGWASENWVSVSEPGQAIQWWMNSTVHRNNILNPRWSELGVGSGIAGNQIIFVAVFGTKGVGQSYTAAPVEAQAAAPAPAPANSASGATYTVRRGDTLIDIAIRHGIDWDTLAYVNGLGGGEFLQIGQTIQLPGIAQGEVIEPDDVVSPAAPVLNAVAADFADFDGEVYTVQEGDTLVSIAASFGITWEELAAFNGIDDRGLLQLGQSLKVPVQNPVQHEDQALRAVSTDATIADATAAEAVTADLAAAPPPDESSLTPVVATEPTVAEIVAQGIPVIVIAPPAPPAPTVAEMTAAPAAQAPAREAPPLFHVVQAGDTIISIAALYGMSWETLAVYNGMGEGAMLQVGQQLELPPLDQR